MQQISSQTQRFIFDKVTVVKPENISAYRALRLRGLTEHPEAFGETAEAFAAKSDQQIQARMNQGGFVLAAISKTGEFLGTVGLIVTEHEKLRHRGMLVGMYVIPECRGQGVGKILIQELLSRA